MLRLSMDNHTSLASVASVSYPREEVWACISQDPFLKVVPSSCLTKAGIHSALFEDNIWGSVGLDFEASIHRKCLLLYVAVCSKL